MLPRNIVVRRAQESDGEFAYQTVERAMRGYALAILGKWPEAEARAHTASDAKSSHSQIIQLGSERVGVLCVDRLPTHHQLDQVM